MAHARQTFPLLLCTIAKRRLPILSFAALFWLSALLPMIAMAQTAQKSDLILAYSPHILPDVDSKDAAAAFSTYATELSKGLNLKVSTIAYENVESVIDLVQKGKIDVASITVLEYLRLRNATGMDLGLGSIRGGKKTYRYLLLTRAGKGYTKLADLKDKRLLLMKGDDLGPLYLDTALLRQHLGESKTFFSQIEVKPKASQVVLPVFFGQADACIVNDVSYKTMAEMNPQLEKDLKPLLSSPELLYGMGIFRAGLPAEFKERIAGVAKNLKNQPRGRQVLLLFKMDDLDVIKESDLSSVRSLVAEYDQLRPHGR